MIILILPILFHLGKVAQAITLPQCPSVVELLLHNQNTAGTNVKETQKLAKEYCCEHDVDWAPYRTHFSRIYEMVFLKRTSAYVQIQAIRQDSFVCRRLESASGLDLVNVEASDQTFSARGDEPTDLELEFHAVTTRSILENEWYDCTRYPFNGRNSDGFDFDYDHGGCNELWARVLFNKFDQQNEEYSIYFEQHCEARDAIPCVANITYSKDKGRLSEHICELIQDEIPDKPDDFTPALPLDEENDDDCQSKSPTPKPSSPPPLSSVPTVAPTANNECEDSLTKTEKVLKETIVARRFWLRAFWTLFGINLTLVGIFCWRNWEALPHCLKRFVAEKLNYITRRGDAQSYVSLMEVSNGVVTHT